MKKQVERTPVDGGYAWVVAGACTVMYMLVIGCLKSYGILYNEFLDHFDSGSGNVALIGSINTAFLFSQGIFYRQWMEVFTIRWIAFLGGTLCFVGFLVSGFVYQLEIMYLTYGVITGVGYGLIFITTRTIICFYFDKHRALASGIVSAGSGVGGVVLPYLYQSLIDEYRLHGALMVIGAVYFNLCVTALLIRQPSSLVKIKLAEKYELQNKEEKSCCVSIKRKLKLLDLSLFKNRSYTILVLGLSIHVSAYFSSFSVLSAHLSSLGFPKHKITICISLIGLSETVSRVFFGWFTDLKLFKTIHIIVFTIMISSIAAFVLPLFNHFEVYVVYAVIMGGFSGTFSGVLPVVLAEYLELEKLAQGIGMNSFLFMLGTAVGKPFAGWIEDYTGTWKSSFVYLGILQSVAAIVLLSEPLVSRICTKKPNDNIASPKTTETVVFSVKL